MNTFIGFIPEKKEVKEKEVKNTRKPKQEPKQEIKEEKE